MNNYRKVFSFNSAMTHHTRSFLVLLAFACCGCATIDKGTNYTLIEPSSRLVHYRVFAGDELELDLFDGTGIQAKVSAVDELNIYSDDGRIIAIDDIQHLRNTYSINLAQGTGALLFYSVAGPLSVLTLPVVLPMVLLHDEDAVKNWQDNRLCRAAQNPTHYANLKSGLDDSQEAIHQQVITEIEKRGLACDATDRAESYCANISDSGKSFMACTASQIPREHYGVVDLVEWSDLGICATLQQFSVEPLDETGSESSIYESEITAEKKRRELVCESIH